MLLDLIGAAARVVVRIALALLAASLIALAIVHFVPRVFMAAIGGGA